MNEKKFWVEKFKEILPDTEEVRRLNEESKILKGRYDTMPEGKEKKKVGERMREIAIKLYEIAQSQKMPAEDETVGDLLKKHPENVIELK